MSEPFASANDTAEQVSRPVELAPGVYGYVSDYDPNCGFVIGPDGVVVIDTRATPSMARTWLEDIRRLTDKPVKYIVLTHYHAVRVLGASAFGDVPVLCSHGTAELIRERGQADYESEFGRFPRLFQGAEEIPGLTLPVISFERELSLWLGERELRLMHLGRGHSKGDTVVWLPDEKVVFAGDLVENRCGVYTGDAYMREWLQTLERLRELGAEKMVPGRGAALIGRQAISEAIDSTKEFILAVLHAVQWGIDQGLDLRGCYEHTDKVMSPVFGNWPIYRHALAFDVARAYDELRGFEHPRIWTAERDRELWQLLHG